jgi:hypothetical protein
MAKGAGFANSVLALIFNAVTLSNIANNAATAPLTSLYVSLHTASPGAAGTQLTSEAAYTSYARVAVARTSGGWTVAANSVSPVANIVFPQATGGSETETYFGVGANTTGATGTLFYYGTVTPNIVVSNGVTPELTTASAITES